MDIIVKIATSELELNDVFNLRHQVFCQETGTIDARSDYFANMIVDQYDAYQSSKNVIAYSGKDPIGVARINYDSKAGLPADTNFDLQDIRSACEKEATILGSVSMLAILPKWRKKRLLQMMFHTICEELQNNKVGTIVANISDQTFPIYRRMGFIRVGNPVWSNKINDNLSLIVSPADSVYKWIYSRSKPKYRTTSLQATN